MFLLRTNSALFFALNKYLQRKETEGRITDVFCLFVIKGRLHLLPLWRCACWECDSWMASLCLVLWECDSALFLIFLRSSDLAGKWCKESRADRGPRPSLRLWRPTALCFFPGLPFRVTPPLRVLWYPDDIVQRRGSRHSQTPPKWGGWAAWKRTAVFDKTAAPSHPHPPQHWAWLPFNPSLDSIHAAGFLSQIKTDPVLVSSLPG